MGRLLTARRMRRDPLHRHAIAVDGQLARRERRPVGGVSHRFVRDEGEVDSVFTPLTMVHAIVPVGDQVLVVEKRDVGACRA
jgi:hypothetical protein